MPDSSPTHLGRPTFTATANLTWNSQYNVRIHRIATDITSAGPGSSGLIHHSIFGHHESKYCLYSIESMTGTAQETILRVSSAHSCLIEACTFRGKADSGANVVAIVNGPGAVIIDCVFENTNTSGIGLDPAGGIPLCINGDLSNWAGYAANGSDNGAFFVATDITTNTNRAYGNSTDSGVIASLHDGAVLNAVKHFHEEIVREVSTAQARPGGSGVAIIHEQIANDNDAWAPNKPKVNPGLGPFGFGSPSGIALGPGAMYYVTGGASVTLSVFVKTRNWATPPTADELFLWVLYPDNGTTGNSEIVTSTEAVSANDTWTEFKVTFTPVTGMVFIAVGLFKYESGADIVVDPIPIIK